MSEAAALPGVRLKAERERRGLSAQKAADEMHLDRWVIEALEGDDYQRVGPSVYAKGHLKKYAALLGLPVAQIMAGYESRPQEYAAPAAAAPSMLLNSRSAAPVSTASTLQIAGSAAAVLLVAGVLWWRPWHQPNSAPSAAPATAAVTGAKTASPPPSGAAAPQMGEQNTVPARGQDTLHGAQDTVRGAQDTVHDAQNPERDVQDALRDSRVTAAAPALVEPSAEAPEAGAGHARLRLSFSADSWVDVHDASGHRTFAGNGLANSVKTIAGTAPMRVYLGFGSGVQLEINDRAVAIGPQFFAGNSARFEAGADGILRRDTHSAQTRSARPPG